MAESILLDLIGSIKTKLADVACQEIALMWRFSDDLDELKVTLSDIPSRCGAAAVQQSCSQGLGSKLKDVLYEIDDVIDESSYDILRRQLLSRSNTKQVRIIFSKFKSNWKLGHKIKDIRERLKVINDSKTQFSFSSQTIVIDTRDQRRETGSYISQEEVIGRNDDMEAIIDLLLNTNTKENIAVVSIVGMGGLGKTAIAQSIYNHNRMTDNQFQLRMWVCVSEEFDVKIIVRKIIESATGNTPDSSLQMDTLEKELKSLIDGKKYLLVMDDMWNEKKEEGLRLKRLLMGGANGSRILITTRAEQVAKTFDTTFLHSLQILDAFNSWLLFQKMTGLEELDNQKEFDHNLNLIKIGHEIVSGLKGVPLVIRTIGGLLKEKKSERFWLSFKDKELYQVLGQGQDEVKEMRMIIQLSYKYLPANLKQCFRYCALFPKDYEIQKDVLIRLWSAQGFIQKDCDNDNLMDIGDDYFMELLSRSFFQEVTKDDLGDIKTCKIHDLMHDVACSISESECACGLIGNVIDKRTHHFSWEEYFSKDQFQGTLSKATNLRTFFMRDDVVASKSEWEKFFLNFFRLRTLCLHSINGFPNGKFWKIIGKLKHLRYLSIKNLGITNLPNSITKLYNLETFILKNSYKLENLSNDVRNLINLKHLDLSWNRDLKLLPDSITELCGLETLILQGCQKLKGLPKDVKNWINLRQLDLSNNENIEFLPNSIIQLNRLESLFLSGCVKLRELPEDVKKLINLKHLGLYGCRALTHMPKGLGELINLQTMNLFVLGKNKGGELNELDGLTKLRGTLRIEPLEFCTNIIDHQTKCKFLQLNSGLERLELNWGEPDEDEPTIGDFNEYQMYESVLNCFQPHSNLREIFICRYNGVKLCNWVSCHSLGCLVTMHLIGCERLQHLPRLDQFPNLKHLMLENLPNMEYIMVNNDDYVTSSSSFCPSLEKLSIAKMPKLERWWKINTTTSTKSPVTFPCLSELQIFQGCPLHVLEFLHAPNLKSLEIDKSEDELDFVPLKNFKNLTSLTLSCLTKLKYFPDSWQHYMTPLQNLSLNSCHNLKRLPKWIGNLTSLTKLDINYCENPTLLPEGIRHTSGLQQLNIFGCPILKERCKKDTGEDWPKIAHIPYLEFSWGIYD